EPRYCSCEARKRMLENPNIPVIFDSLLREHHLIYEGKHKGRMILRFCPFCGGRLEDSRRRALFKIVSEKTAQEIVHQVVDLNDRKAIEQRFGPPSKEWLGSELDVADDAKKGKVQAALSYSNISKAADVVFILWTKSAPEIRVLPKPKEIGSP
ncbi:MAG: hypothetical protein NTW20_03265, partial [Rhodobacterales bacterium]|nr:hypothetical protein [Rhodobacterales bacterium]